MRLIQRNLYLELFLLICLVEGRVVRFDTDKLEWIRAPKSYEISEDQIVIITEPGTDLWQRTYYGFQNDNAPDFSGWGALRQIWDTRIGPQRISPPL